MKRSILEQLYYGVLRPASQHTKKMKQYEIAQKNAASAYESFLTKLPENLKSEFIDTMDRQWKLLPLEDEQSFIDGFRLGIKMMAEVFLEAKSDQKEEL
ncbi:MAG: hypothetical protein KHZ62_05595 [Clostridiales bacterium]|nr:hypothetical protein [Clostridiales bacterium]